MAGISTSIQALELETENVSSSGVEKPQKPQSAEKHDVEPSSVGEQGKVRHKANEEDSSPARFGGAMSNQGEQHTDSQEATDEGVPEIRPDDVD